MTPDAGRIRTTHTGSLPRPRDLVGLLQDRETGGRPPGFDARVRAGQCSTS
jgi:hypothetical protein